MSEIVYQDDLSKVILVDNVEDIKEYTDVEFVDKVIGFYDAWKDDGDFYLIHKNRQHQYYIFQQSISNIDYFDEEFNKVSVVDFKTNLKDVGFTGALRYINENIGGEDSDIYEALLKLSNNKSINKSYLRIYNNYISDVKISERNPSRSIFVLKFDDEEYFQILNLDEDERYFVNSVYSYYGYQWSESADLQSEWEEGYIIRSLNIENLNKIKTVLINNGEEELSQMTDDDAVRKACNMLDDLYPDEVSTILREYGYAMDEESDKAAKADIYKSYCNPLFRYGIIMSSCLSQYLVSTTKLKQIYDEVGIPELSLPEVLQKYFEDRGVSFDQNLQEYRYEYQQVDTEQFNRNASSELDKMISDSESEMDENSVKIKEIIKKYGVRKNVKTPKGAFRINSYDLKDGTIDYSFSKGENYVAYNSERRRATYDDFNTFLNNYELFENKIIKLLRQLNEQDEVNKDEQLAIDFLGKLPDVKPKTGIDFLKQEVEDYKNSTGNNLDLKTVLRLSDNPKSNFPFKIELFGVNLGDTQKIISTFSYDINPKVKFTLTHNPIWDKNLPGVTVKL